MAQQQPPYVHVRLRSRFSSGFLFGLGFFAAGAVISIIGGIAWVVVIVALVGAGSR